MMQYWEINLTSDKLEEYNMKVDILDRNREIQFHLSFFYATNVESAKTFLIKKIICSIWKVGGYDIHSPFPNTIMFKNRYNGRESENKEFNRNFDGLIKIFANSNYTLSVIRNTKTLSHYNHSFGVIKDQLNNLSEKEFNELVNGN